MFGVAVIVLLGAVTVWAVRYLRRQWMLSKIPGPSPCWPVIGNAFDIKLDGNGFYNQLFELCTKYQNKSTFKLMIGPQAFVYIYHPETAEVIFSSTKHITKPSSYDMLHPWLGTGLLTSTGEKWWSRRKLLTPAFHFRILEDFLQVFNEQAAVMVERLEERVGGDTFDVFPYITLCAVDIICETAMGRTVNAQVNTDSEYVAAVFKISRLVLERTKVPWMWPDAIFSRTAAGKEHNECLRILHGFTRKVIQERKASLAEHAAEQEDPVTPRRQRNRRLAFLDLLLQMAQEAGLTVEDIKEEVDTFMFEGHDTTAAAATWALYMIGSNPDVQDRLHAELDGLFAGDSERPVTTEDLNNMKYMEMVIKETLRLYPSVPLMGRVLEEDTVFGDYVVPKGSAMMVVTYMLHRDPDHYPDPERFDPERFDPARIATRHPFSYVPFSAGQRNCIGQKFAMREEKVLLSSILRRFRIQSTQTVEELKPMSELILRPRDGIRLKLTRRSHSE